MEDTWFQRDRLVLDAAVRIHDQTGQSTITAAALERESGLDKDTVRRALHALRTGDYFDKVLGTAQGPIMRVGRPTAEARRAVGAWPSGAGLAERLVAALESAADDATRPDEERSKFRQAATWIKGFGYQVAVGALGGAAGNFVN